MSLGKRLIILVVALAGVQVVIVTKFTEELAQTTRLEQAPLQAVCYVALMLAAILGVGPEADGRKFTLAGIVIFGLEIVSNILISYGYGQNHIDVQAVRHIFPMVGSDLDSRRYVAMAFGAGLSVVSLLCWLGVADMLRAFYRQHQADKERKATRLAQMNASHGLGAPAMVQNPNGHHQAGFHQQATKEVG